MSLRFQMGSGTSPIDLIEITIDLNDSHYSYREYYENFYSRSPVNYPCIKRMCLSKRLPNYIGTEIISRPKLRESK